MCQSTRVMGPEASLQNGSAMHRAHDQIQHPLRRPSSSRYSFPEVNLFVGECLIG